MKYLFICFLFVIGCAGNKTYTSMQEMLEQRIAASNKIAEAEKKLYALGTGANPSAVRLLGQAHETLNIGDYAAAFNLAEQARQEADKPYKAEPADQVARKIAEGAEAGLPAGGMTYKYYTVRPWHRSKDCLWNISRRFYGTGFKWRLIYLANTDLIKDPHHIKRGMVLKIPGQWSKI